eukprot:scaffold46902_cov32-Attheya_sp.AAC.2
MVWCGMWVYSWLYPPSSRPCAAPLQITRINITIRLLEDKKRAAGQIKSNQINDEETSTMSKKRKSNQLLLDVPPLPTMIWGNQVLPFLADRKSFNSLASASKEIHNISQQLIASKTITPPWPKTSIRVGSSACSVAFSPDGGLLASGCQDRRVRIWNCSNGRYITLAGHTSFINSVKFSIDGNILASASSDRTIRLWRLADHSCQVLEGHEEEVRDIAFSPDGACLVSGDNNGFVRLWDLNDGRCTRTLRDERLGMIYSVAFSPDGRTIASAGQNGGDGTGTISFWVLSDHAFTSHRATAIIDDIDDDGMVRTISFSPDSRYLASVDNDAEAP